MKHYRKQRHAFTLVELSIVLVILGLLVGGVLSGQSLIRAAELRSVTNERAQFETALHTFRDKYMGMPGDLPNATSFWGARDADPSACAVAASNGMATCNGNGNGMIFDYEAAVAGQREFLYAWQHLGNAGLIAGEYTGKDDSDYGITPGINVPASKLGGRAGWGIRSLHANIPDDTNEITMPGNYAENFLELGMTEPGGTDPQLPVLTGQDTYTIDRKSDDGSPRTGKLRTYRHEFHANCATSANQAYDLDNPELGCVLIFLLR